VHQVLCDGPLFGSDEVILEYAATKVIDLESRGLGALAGELIRMCLEPDPGKRPSAIEVMQHPWFAKPRGEDRSGTRRDILASAPPPIGDEFWLEDSPT
jgi:serine/threonine protein kinase